MNSSISKRFFCRSCNTMLGYNAERKVNQCSSCKKDMILIDNPVHINILSINTVASKQQVEKYIFRLFIEYRIDRGVVDLLKHLPCKVINFISYEESEKIARTLKQMNCVVSIISEITGKEATSIKQVSTPEPTPVPVEKPETPGKLKVLLVEDNKMQRDCIYAILDSMGTLDVTMAEHGIAGVRELAKTRFELIITDLTMPMMDGIKLMHYVRSNKDTAKIPIIVLTARATQSDVSKAIQFKVEGYLLKPVEKQKVISKVNATIKAIKSNSTVAITG